jgi:hypothetical protein
MPRFTDVQILKQCLDATSAHQIVRTERFLHCPMGVRRALPQWPHDGEICKKVIIDRFLVHIFHPAHPSPISRIPGIR